MIYTQSARTGFQPRAVWNERVSVTLTRHKGVFLVTAFINAGNGLSSQTVTENNEADAVHTFERLAAKI